MKRLADAVINYILEKLPRIGRKLRYQDRLSAWQQTATSSQQQKVWGYAGRHSIEPGQGFQLILSAGPVEKAVKGRVEICRIGYEKNSDRRYIWRSQSLQVSPYMAMRAGRRSRLLENTAAALGPGWPPTLEVSETGGWQSGYYAVDFVSECGQRDRDIAYIVVTDPDKSGDILVKLATATYQAYNNWGGHSLYDDDNDPTKTRGHMVSFDRPTRTEFYDWEYHYVLWLEQLAQQQGLNVAYATNYDLMRDPALAEGYKLFVSVGHDEYWSKEEFEATHKRIFKDGGNTLFLGANLGYWQVRYADVNSPGGQAGRQLVCYKSVWDPVQYSVDEPNRFITARFREQARLPETGLMGVAYQSNFKTRWAPGYDYCAKEVNHPLFAGTGYKQGDTVTGLIGHEWDNRDPEVDFSPPGEQRIEGASRLFDQQRSLISAVAPDSISVLFTGKPVDLFGREGLAEAITFCSPAGGHVFSAGTIRWSWGLSKEGFVQEKFCRFNTNLHLQMLGLGGDLN